MDKETLLSELRLLQESLPENFVVNDRARSGVAESDQQFLANEKALRDARINEPEYDEDEVEKIENEKAGFVQELTILSDELVQSEIYRDGVKEEIEDLNFEIEKVYSPMIAKCEEEIEELDKKFNEIDHIKNPEQRDRIVYEKAQKLKELKQYNKLLEKKKARLDNRNTRLFEVSELIETKKASINTLQEDITKANNAVLEVKEAGKKAREAKIEGFEKDSEALYWTSRYFESDPKNTLNVIIRDFDKGLITEEQVLNDLKDIRGQIKNGIYDATEIKVGETSFEDSLDSAIEKISGEKVSKDEKFLPAFIDNFTPEQKEKYEEIMSKLTPQEKKEVEKELQEKVNNDTLLPILDTNEKVATDPVAIDAPIPSQESSKQEEKAPILKDGPKTKVKKFKDVSKEKVEKIKTWFKKNWKKVAATALVIVALGSSMCGKGKSDEKKVSTPAATVTFQMTDQELPEASVPVFEEPEKEPEITPAPTTSPEITPEPTTPEPTTPEPTTPEPTTPEPTTPEPTTPEPTTYVLETVTPGNTGDIAPADEEVPYLHGESMYDPETQTWIDSEGTKITGHEDGSFSTQQEAVEATPIEGTSTVLLEEPDFTPIEQETPTVVEAPTIEEALETGELTPEQAAEAQSTFDDLFSEVYGQNTQGRGK